MRKYITILILLLSVVVAAQGSSNRFSDNQNEDRAPNVYAEPNTDVVSQPNVAEADGPNGPPGGDDLPIDDYIPVLVIIALGTIVYTTYRKKTLS